MMSFQSEVAEMDGHRISALRPRRKRSSGGVGIDVAKLATVISRRGGEIGNGVDRLAAAVATELGVGDRPLDVLDDSRTAWMLYC